MWFLSVVTYLAIIVQLLFVTISMAAGLYYLAELVEEYTTEAKKLICLINNVILGLYIMLWFFENFPLTMIITGIISHMINYIILKNFPFVSFTSPSLILAVILLIVNHYLTFSYFATVYHPFSEVISFFTIYLWLVPFALFVSLSANDNVLPTTADRTDGDVVTNYFSKRGKKYRLLTLFNYAKESLLPVRTKKGF